MANIVKCKKCKGNIFVPDIGESTPLSELRKGTTFLPSQETNDCLCDRHMETMKKQYGRHWNGPIFVSCPCPKCSPRC